MTRGAILLEPGSLLFRCCELFTKWDKHVFDIPIRVNGAVEEELSNYTASGCGTADTNFWLRLLESFMGFSVAHVFEL